MMNEGIGQSESATNKESVEKRFIASGKSTDTTQQKKRENKRAEMNREEQGVRTGCPLVVKKTRAQDFPLHWGGDCQLCRTKARTKRKHIEDIALLVAPVMKMENNEP